MAYEFKEWDYRKLAEDVPADMLMTWGVYFNIRRKEHTKQDYALARLNATVHNLMATHPVSDEDFLITFQTAEEQEERQAQLDNNFFAALAGIAEAQKGV